MRNFHSLVVLRRPRQELWTIMRDHLVAFGGRIADIEDVRQLSRTPDVDGVVRIVNAWRARQQVPPAIRSMLQIDELSWIERTSWNEAASACDWTIEPSFLGEQIMCSGTTTFAVAMGGRGTRVSFTGELDVKPGLLSRLGSMEPMASGFLETVVTTLVPRNLRAVAEAAAEFQPISAP